MGVPFGYQVYDVFFSSDKLRQQFNDEGRALFKQFEELGLKVLLFYSKFDKTELVRIYHPNRALDIEEVKPVNNFYGGHCAGSLSFGFADEISYPDSEKWELIYQSSPSVVSEAEQIVQGVPSEPDRKPSQSEIDFAVAAAELNEAFPDTGEQITKMQVDAAVRNANRVENLRASGKYRILSVDTYDYSDGELVYDFESEEDALIFIWLSDQLEKLSFQIRKFEKRGKADEWYARIKEFRNHMKGLQNGTIHAAEIEHGISVQKLRKRLKRFERVHVGTGEIKYLYDPEGNWIGTYQI